MSPETISWYTQACVFHADSYFFSPPHSTASIFSIWCSFTSNNRQLYVYTFSSTILTWWLCCQSRTVPDKYAWSIIEDLLQTAWKSITGLTRFQWIKKHLFILITTNKMNYHELLVYVEGSCFCLVFITWNLSKKASGGTLIITMSSLSSLVN